MQILQDEALVELELLSYHRIGYGYDEGAAVVDAVGGAVLGVGRAYDLGPVFDDFVLEGILADLVLLEHAVEHGSHGTLGLRSFPWVVLGDAAKIGDEPLDAFAEFVRLIGHLKGRRVKDVGGGERRRRPGAPRWLRPLRGKARPAAGSIPASKCDVHACSRLEEHLSGLA